jgi:PAS domain S-box-containing protein
MRIGIGSKRGDEPGGRARLRPAVRRMRRILDTDAVLHAAAAEAVAAAHAQRAEVWLSTDGGLRLVASAGRPGPAGNEPPDVVTVCARRGKTATGPGMLAIPIPAPRRGQVGVLCLHGGDPRTTDLVVGIVEETGLAYEAANLFESAVAALGRTEAVLERVADGVVVTGGDGTIQRTNRAARRLIGPAADDAGGSPCAAVLGLHVGERQLDCSHGCALLGEPSATSPGVDAWRMRADGRRQPLLVSASQVLARDGSVSEVVHSLRDITALKQADEAKTMFLATASHELKTPLTVILGFAQTMLSGKLSSEQSEQALRSIERRAGELTRIVDRLLLTGRIESGRVTVQPHAMPVGEILSERCASLASATGRDVQTAVPDDLPDALADADALTTVVDHLIDNAVKYSPDGQAVRVTAHPTPAHIEIAFADRGIGMDAEQVDRCFERFWQAESTDIRRFGGTGVGLYIVRSLVEAMNGTVIARSELGTGSTFVVRLPRAVPETGTEPAPVEDVAAGVLGERSMIKEFMRQIGIPSGGT